MRISNPGAAVGRPEGLRYLRSARAGWRVAGTVSARASWRVAQTFRSAPVSVRGNEQAGQAEMGTEG